VLRGGTWGYFKPRATGGEQNWRFPTKIVWVLAGPLERIRETED